ncbi:MAG TPA: pyridoxal-dependent decarboxylase [Blastocatellia bacterium]|nr:pyridoxal-dependent decarboxylase [Blastocatellia bacterium]
MKKPKTKAISFPPGDMSSAEFRELGHKLIDWVADYLSHPERYPVLAQVAPGFLTGTLPETPPASGESMDQIVSDLDRLIVPGVTHWNHPAFFAYFAISGSGPGILGELLAAAFNVNAMLWRTSPAATELEEVTLVWLQRLLGLSDRFSGVIYDTASISSLCAIAAAREAVTEIQVRSEGLGAVPAGSSAPLRLRLYCSEQAHSSIDKAAITLGLGQAGIRKIRTDSEFRMNVEDLDRAVAEDRASGWRPFCVVATVGTTSTTSVDPVPEIAAVCEREGLWLHVDAAYAGSAAILPEMKWLLDGCEQADSLVMNPHKWLFVPVDLSVLYCRRMNVLKQAFSLVPEYLRSAEPDSVSNFMDYGPQLGRRFRALKLWFVMRYFGSDGLGAIIREHIRLAQEFAGWVDDSPDFERLAPTPLSTVCFRARPRDLTGSDEKATRYLDALNQRLLEEVNRRGRVFLSHTKLNEVLTLRLAVGNIRTTIEHVRMAWDELSRVLPEIDVEMRPRDIR